MALKLAHCKQQEKLFTKLESHFIPLASDIIGHQVIKVAYETATSHQKKHLQSKLSNKGVLLSLLASSSGTSIIQLLADGEAGSAFRAALVNSLLLQLSNIAVLPTALPFLQELLETEVSSGLHPLAIELSSYPCLPTLLHHPTGHLLLEALVNKDLGAPTLHIASWVLRHMEEMVKCPYAASLASNILPIILSHVTDPNYGSMLTRCQTLMYQECGHESLTSRLLYQFCCQWYHCFLGSKRLLATLILRGLFEKYVLID